MNIIGLTHAVTDIMPTYPGDPVPSLRQIASIEKDGYMNYVFSTGVHVGTHIDAPAHMIEGGKRIDKLRLDSFRGPGVLIDAREKKEMGIEILRNRDIERGDVVLFCTGFSKKYREKSYFTDFPVVAEALAKELVKLKVKMVGFDTGSPDRAPYAVHKILLGAGILIIENLTNLEALLPHRHFDVQAFPLNIVADAAPTRVIALVV